MITRLTFVRHGQSETNLRHVYAGARSDVALTEHGRAQARTAGLLLRSLSINHIIASDFDRARTTAEIIAATIEYPVEQIQYDPRLREISVGKLTGQPDEGFSAYLAHLAAKTDPTAETIEAVERRLSDFLDDLSKRDGSILLVAHAGIGRVLRSLLTGVSIDDVAKLDVPNAHPFELPLERIKQGEE